MSTAGPREIFLGCTQQVRVVIIEDAGNLVIQVFAQDPAVTDIDALFFNLTDDSVSDGLTIFPSINVENVTGFDVATGTLNQMNNGAQIQEAYDVRIEFGTLSDTSQGDVDQAAFTLYVDGEIPLTAESIDLSNMTAVINSDGGNGLALTGGTGGVATEVETVVAEDDFTGLTYASQSDIVAWGSGWRATNGQLEANGCADGNLWFETQQIAGEASFSFDARSPHTQNFENGGWAGDSLEVWVLINGSQWELLDTFTVNAAGTALVGDTTGQTITSQSQTLTYEGGALADADSVQFVLDADFTAADERVLIDNVQITDTVTTGGATETVETTVADEDFNGLWYPGQSDEIAHGGRWDITSGGELRTDGCNDGQIWFEEVQTGGDTTISMDARAPNTQYFENSGWGADHLQVWALVDGTTWQHLDTFTVNNAGTALVGSRTGQEITAERGTLEWSGGLLDDADSVQLYMYSDISAANERIFFDNYEVTVAEDIPVDAEPDCGEYAVTYDDLMAMAANAEETASEEESDEAELMPV